jgi:hypothetical protein
MWACKYGFNVHGLCKTKLSCIGQDPKALRFNPTPPNPLNLLVFLSMVFCFIMTWNWGYIHDVCFKFRSSLLNSYFQVHKIAKSFNTTCKCSSHSMFCHLFDHQTNCHLKLGFTNAHYHLLLNITTHNQLLKCISNYYLPH